MTTYRNVDELTAILRHRLQGAYSRSRPRRRRLSRLLRELSAKGLSVGFHTNNGRYYPVDMTDKKFLAEHSGDMFVLEEVEYYDG